MVAATLAVLAVLLVGCGGSHHRASVPTTAPRLPVPTIAPGLRSFCGQLAAVIDGLASLAPASASPARLDQGVMAVAALRPDAPAGARGAVATLHDALSTLARPDTGSTARVAPWPGPPAAEGALSVYDGAGRVALPAG